MKTWRMVLVAGESSGDIIGSYLIQSIKRFIQPWNQAIEFYGVGGDAMAHAVLSGHSTQECKFHSLIPMSHLNVMGITDVVRSLPRLLYNKHLLLKRIKEVSPDVVVLIDFKAFNHRIAQGLQEQRRNHMALIQYVAPSIWAWKQSNVKKSVRFCSMYDHVLALYPFEKQHWDKMGVNNLRIVGSPAMEAEMLRRRDRGKQDATENKYHVVVLPGSRAQELYHIMRVIPTTLMNLASESVETELRVAFVVAPLVKDLFMHKYLPQLNAKLGNSRVAVSIIINSWPSTDLHSIFRSSEIALVTSGTTVMEAALSNVPTLCVYRTDPITAWFAKRKAKVRFASIPNIIADKMLIPELLFDRCTVEQVSAAASQLLRNRTKELSENELQLRQIMQGMVHSCGDKLPSEHAAQIIVEQMMTKASVI